MTIFAALRRRAAQRRLDAELIEFDDRLLRDIGFTRRSDFRARLVDIGFADIVASHARA
jgi:hypothetical protein